MSRNTGDRSGARISAAPAVGETRVLKNPTSPTAPTRSNMMAIAWPAEYMSSGVRSSDGSGLDEPSPPSGVRPNRRVPMPDHARSMARPDPREMPSDTGAGRRMIENACQTFSEPSAVGVGQTVLVVV
ncbi:MAG: hypothetical protein EBS56_05445 [Planctomycetia bacterium]|nr:hypothetical protein [Planctomycetia bacterium]